MCHIQMIYLCLARAQASGHDRLVCDDDPVGESVHSVLKLGMTLQVGLHLSHLVQQFMGYLQRKGGVKNEWKMDGGETAEQQGEQEMLWLSQCCKTWQI